MNQPLPPEFAHEYMQLVRRESFLRGLLAGALLTVLVMVAAVLFWPSQARAQTIPEQADQFRRPLTRYGHFVWGVSAPVSTFAAQIHQESRWNEAAVSRVGARGLAQFMPSTARWIQDAYPAELAGDVASADWGMRALVRYNRWLWDRLPSPDRCERMAFTLAAYNGGLGWVNKRRAASPTPNTCLFAACDINPGVHPANQRENEQYPRRILLTIEPMYHAAGWGPGSCTH